LLLQGWIPDAVERQLYLNVLRLLFTVLDDVLSSVRLNILGHTLALDWRPGDGMSCSSDQQAPPVDMVVVRRLTDRMLLDHNLAWLPDDIERQLYDNVHKLVLALLNEVMASASLAVGGSVFHVDLTPLAETPASGDSTNLTDIETALLSLRQREVALSASYHKELAQLKHEKMDLKARRARAC